MVSCDEYDLARHVRDRVERGEHSRTGELSMRYQNSSRVDRESVQRDSLLKSVWIHKGISS